MRNGLGLLAAICLVIASFWLSVFVFVPAEPSTDFVMLWTGAQLLGPDLYSWTRAGDVQHANGMALAGAPGFVRIPAMAVALWPFGQAPFQAALRAWQVLNLCALLAFVWIWSPRPLAFLAAALFPPVWFAIHLGQETCLLLLVMGAAARMMERHRDIRGGALLALCAMKPHLFLFVPVLLLAQRRWRAMGGMLLGGSAIYALSAAVAGWDWPVKFATSIAINRETFRLVSPGLATAFMYFRTPAWMIAATEALLAVLIWRKLRSEQWIPAVTCTLALGVLFAPWSFFYDLGMLLPMALSMFSGELAPKGAAAVQRRARAMNGELGTLRQET